MFVCLLLLAILAGGCAKSAAPDSPATIHLTSPAFKDGGALPAQYSCGGAGISPPLAWKPLPPHTASVAVICIDPDAPGGDFTHWLLWNLPAGTQSLAEGAVPAGARQGKNDFGNVGYGPPCPPAGSPHHYIFTVYALDSAPNVTQGASRSDLLSAMRGHILAQGQLTAVYGR